MLDVGFATEQQSAVTPSRRPSCPYRAQYKPGSSGITVRLRSKPTDGHMWPSVRPCRLLSGLPYMRRYSRTSDDSFASFIRSPAFTFQRSSPLSMRRDISGSDSTSSPTDPVAARGRVQPYSLQIRSQQTTTHRCSTGTDDEPRDPAVLGLLIPCSCPGIPGRTRTHISVARRVLQRLRCERNLR